MSDLAQPASIVRSGSGNMRPTVATPPPTRTFGSDNQKQSYSGAHFLLLLLLVAVVGTLDAVVGCLTSYLVPSRRGRLQSEALGSALIRGTRSPTTPGSWEPAHTGP